MPNVCRVMILIRRRTCLRQRLQRGARCTHLFILACLTTAILYCYIHLTRSSHDSHSVRPSPHGLNNSHHAVPTVRSTDSPLRQQQWQPRWNLTETVAAPDRASAVREMTRFAWRGYMTLCALAQNGNELAPAFNSCSPESDSLFGANNLLTAIDSMDTLALMDLRSEFRQGRELIRRGFRPLRTQVKVSVFETTIRIIGGLLGAFSLDGDPLFANLAAQVADGLSGAFVNDRFPRMTMLVTNSSAIANARNEGGSQDAADITLTYPAEVGSQYLELAYLTELTGNKKYLDWAIRRQNSLRDVASLDGVMPIQLVATSPWKLESAVKAYSAGSGTDSYYEYLVKRCLFDQQVEPTCISEFTRALDGIVKHLTVYTGADSTNRPMSNYTCIVTLDVGAKMQCTMEHLTCFAGGMFALAYLQNRSRSDWLSYAENVTRTCYVSYLDSATRLGPEQFSYDAKSGKLIAMDNRYLLRPETVESIFYLYRITGNQMYREWGWNIAMALNSTARSHAGFSGLRDMSGSRTPVFDNVQWSFFLAETLKYLYLLFSSSRKLPMDQWIFNTEAHVLPSRLNSARGRLAKRALQSDSRNN